MCVDDRMTAEHAVTGITDRSPVWQSNYVVDSDNHLLIMVFAN